MMYKALSIILVLVFGQALAFTLSNFIKNKRWVKISRNYYFSKQGKQSDIVSSPDPLSVIIARTLYLIITLVSVGVAMVIAGIKLSSIIAVIASLSIALGFLMQDMFQDTIAGFNVALANHFAIGDTIQYYNDDKDMSAAKLGQITDFNIYNTYLIDGSGSIIIIPNRILQNSIISNASSVGHYEQFIYIGISSQYEGSWYSLTKLIKRSLKTSKAFKDTVKDVDVYVDEMASRNVIQGGTVLVVRLKFDGKYMVSQSELGKIKTFIRQVLSAFNIPLFESKL